jgi:ATP adenylyltransferase
MLRFLSYIYAFKKRDYIKGNKNRIKDDCPLCLICEDCEGNKKDKSSNGKCLKNNVIVNLHVFQTDKIVCCINLYPYNSGHIMLFPKRHIVDFREFEDDELNHINFFTKFMLNIIDEIYNPTGYNIGFNIGEFAGASINHLHLHIIPRFKNELGLIDIIGGAKVIIEDPNETLKKLRAKVKEKVEGDKNKICAKYNVKISDK